MKTESLTEGFILEDLLPAQKWLAEVLEQTFPGIRVQLAARIAAAREYLDQTSSAPGIALIDLSLPDGNGLEILQAIKRRWPDAFCVVTTIYDDDSHLFPALEAGADGYLLKDRPKPELVDALRRVLNGEPPLSPAIAQRIMGSFARQSSLSASEDLTPRQLEVLRMIARGDTIKDVSHHLGISYHTAASHIRGIYERLGVSSRAEATAKAIKMRLE